MRALGAMRSLVLALLVVAVAAQSPYPEDGLVRALTDDEFEAAVMENGREAWAIAFHTDGCAPCASMAPHFTKAAKSMRGIVNFGHVRLSEDGDSMEIARKVGLTRVPVVLGFPAHKLINPYGGPSSKQGVEYRNSTSSAKKIADFAASLLPDDAVTRVTTREALDEMRSFASPLGLPTSVLVTSKDSTGSLHRSLALRFRGRAAFAEVHASAVADVLPDAGVAEDDAPTLLVLPATEGAGSIARHDGEMDAESLAAFLDAAVAPAPEDDAPEERDPRVENAKRGGSERSDKRTRGESRPTDSMFPAVTAGEFDSVVLTVEPVILTAFTRLASPRCLNASREIGAALLGIAGHVGMVEVNASDPTNREIVERYAPATVAGEDDAAKCVELALFPHGREKEESDPEVYAGPIEAAALEAWVYESVPDFVMTLEDSLVDNFLSTDPLKPKVVLFHEGERPPRTFVALAANFQEDFVFAMIPESDKGNAEKFGVTAYPAIRLLYLPPLEPGQTPGPEGLQYQAAAYPAPRLVYQEMHGWMQQVQIQVLGKDISGGAGSRAAAAKPAVLVSTDAEFEAACGAAPLCAVCFVARDDATGGVASPAEEKTVDALTRRMADTPLAFVYVDPKAQRSFASAFEVEPADVPAVTVVSTRKNRFATYAKTFDAEGAGAFLADVLSAKQRTRMIQELPKLVEGGEAPAEEEEEAIVEEEFDLSDVLGEEVEGEAAMSKEEMAARIEKEIEEEAKAAKEAAEAELAAKKKAEKKKAKKKKAKKKAAKAEL